MKELVNFSVYPFDLEPFGNWEEALGHWRSLGLDGLELLTAFDGTHDAPAEAATAVHLPYWMDWYHLWRGLPLPGDLDGEEPLYYFGGHVREDLPAHLARFLADAAALEPEYAVFHLANAGADEILTNGHFHNDEMILLALAELIGKAVEVFGGRPPVRLFFENLWWPGLTFLDGQAIEAFAGALPFDDWAFLLDVGHLLNTSVPSDEKEAADYVVACLDRLPPWVVDRIEGVHLHRSLSGRRRIEEGFFRRPDDLQGLTLGQKAQRAREMLQVVDEHRPFETEAVRPIIDRIKPAYVTHELSAPTAEAKSASVAIQRRALGWSQ